MNNLSITPLHQWIYSSILQKLYPINFTWDMCCQESECFFSSDSRPETIISLWQWLAINGISQTKGLFHWSSVWGKHSWKNYVTLTTILFHRMKVLSLIENIEVPIIYLTHFSHRMEGPYWEEQAEQLGTTTPSNASSYL